MIFTGSTVVDEHNTSGFCTAGKPCLVAVYTGHTPRAANGKPLQTQNLAYSNDRGRTWTKYSGNPVLNLNLPDFRDPHVFWSAAARRWVMAVALPNDHKVLFYGSADLKHWERLSEFGPAGATGGQWECPTLTEVPVEGGGPHRTRWVLKVGLESRRTPGRLRRAVFRRHLRRRPLRQRQSALHHPLDRLRQGLLLRPHLQQPAAHGKLPSCSAG